MRIGDYYIVRTRFGDIKEDLCKVVDLRDKQGGTLIDFLCLRNNKEITRCLQSELDDERDDIIRPVTDVELLQHRLTVGPL